MSSMNDACRFIYANETSDSFGVQLCSAFGSSSRTGNSENRNIVTSKNLLGKKFNFHGVIYDSPLVFDIIIYNEDGSWINEDKERALKKWLLKEDMYWFQADQPSLADIQYFCIANKAEMLDIGSYSGGMLVQFTCDSYYAYSELRKKAYITVSNTLSFKLNMDTDFDKHPILPNVIITALSSGNISIVNSTTSESIIINNCITGEVINIETGSDKISSTNTNIISRWNKGDFSFVDGANQIVLTGNFKVSFEYRLPIRVGA